MRSLRVRVTLAAVAGWILVLGVAGGVGLNLYADQELDRLDVELQERAWRAVEEFGGRGIRKEPAQGVCCVPDDYSVRIYFQSRRRPVYEQGENFPRVNTLGSSDVRWGSRRWRVHVAEANYTYGTGVAPTAQAAAATQPLDERVARMRNLLLAMLLGGALVVGAGVWLMAGAALAALPRMRDRARELSASADTTQRLATDGPLEVEETADALNRMLDRLQVDYRRARAALDATRTFTADAGHELRTPLTSLRANLDVLARDDLPADDRDRALRDSLGAHERLTALIEGLQTLARGDAASVALKPVPVDLAELADAAVLDARRRHPEVAFEFEGSPVAPVEGDPDGLRMLLDNLLENAAIHGGRRVRVHVREGDGFAQLSVDDDGPGIPDAEKGRVFERFSRGSAARNGTGSGLGLAIAAQQAELHGSRLKLDDSPLGGARFELLLSARAAS